MLRFGVSEQSVEALSNLFYQRRQRADAMQKAKEEKKTTRRFSLGVIFFLSFNYLFLELSRFFFICIAFVWCFVEQIF